MEFECVRCTRFVNNEEKYLLFKGIYCRACMDWIESDPDYAFIFKRNNIVPMRDLDKFWQLKNIEN